MGLGDLLVLTGPLAWPSRLVFGLRCGTVTSSHLCHLYTRVFFFGTFLPLEFGSGATKEEHRHEHGRLGSLSQHLVCVDGVRGSRRVSRWNWGIIRHMCEGEGGCFICGFGL